MLPSLWRITFTAGGGNSIAASIYTNSYLITPQWSIRPGLQHKLPSLDLQSNLAGFYQSLFCMQIYTGEEKGVKSFQVAGSRFSWHVRAHRHILRTFITSGHSRNQDLCVLSHTHTPSTGEERHFHSVLWVHADFTNDTASFSIYFGEWKVPKAWLLCSKPIKIRSHCTATMLKNPLYNGSVMYLLLKNVMRQSGITQVGVKPSPP